MKKTFEQPGDLFETHNTLNGRVEICFIYSTKIIQFKKELYNVEYYVTLLLYKSSDNSLTTTSYFVLLYGRVNI